MILNFVYETQLEFSRAVTEHHYSIRCFPQNTLRQKICAASLVVEPAGIQLSEVDFFGGRIVSGFIEQPHSSFRITLSGSAMTGLDISEHEDFENLELFRCQSPYTAPGHEIRSFFEKLSGSKEFPDTTYSQALFLMHCLHEKLRYVPRSTDVHTTAEQAFSKGCGVCQDYSHVLLSLMRLAGIPCRYVVGLMTGEGQSHAWVEGNFKGHWYGLDPANNQLTDGNYIKISHGRDWHNCIVSRGVFKTPFGLTEQKQTVNVSVKKNQSDQQPNESSGLSQ